MRNIIDYNYYIFDLGGIIINIDYTRSIQAFEDLGIPNFDKLYNQFTQTDIFDLFETGKISAQHFINKLLDHLPSGISPNKVVSAWNAMILDAPKERIQLLQQLRSSGKQIYMLSNINEIHHERAWREWAKSSSLMPEEIYNKLYLSHQIGLRKPNTEVFEFVCKDIGIQPEQALFVDDSIQHIESARNFGLNTVHLTGEMEFVQLFS